MTPEEKQLLFKDLSMRLPHHVYIQAKGYSTPIELRHLSLDSIPNVKPYLRPMSSMTEEEENELDKIDKESSRIFFDDLHSRVEKFGREKLRGFLPDYKTLDYLIAHHFDYRGLIPMGLALEAKEWMYKIE